MHGNHWRTALLIVLASTVVGCGRAAEESAPPIAVAPGDFGKTWHQGKAELTRYALNQARYGEMREGDAVLIFVTEDFLADQQVKRDFGSDEAYNVLKLNFTKKFQTGVYPYSIMTSVFTRVDFENPWTAKATFTSQEWCGHVFMQLNHEDRGYRGAIHSYFQSEGDQKLDLGEIPLEDEIWVLIRMAPDKLPLGEFEMLPSMEHLRLRHREAKPLSVKASLTLESDETFAAEPLYVYRLEYPGIERTLAIHFRGEAPYEIEGWRETTPSRDGGQLTTEAVRTHRKMLAYWGRNKNADRALLSELGLD